MEPETARWASYIVFGIAWTIFWPALWHFTVLVYRHGIPPAPERPPRKNWWTRDDLS